MKRFFKMNALKNFTCKWHFNFSNGYYRSYAGIILCLHQANERRGCIITSSLIGWAHTQMIPGLSGYFIQTANGLHFSQMTDNKRHISTNTSCVLHHSTNTTASNIQCAYCILEQTLLWMSTYPYSNSPKATFKYKLRTDSYNAMGENITLKFGGQLGSSAVEMTIDCHSNWKKHRSHNFKTFQDLMIKLMVYWQEPQALDSTWRHDVSKLPDWVLKYLDRFGLWHPTSEWCFQNA